MRTYRSLSALVSAALVALVLGAPASADAQSRGLLVGMVVDRSDGVVLTDATVSVVESGHSAAADDGRFLLPDLPARQLTVRIEAPGYSTVVERIEGRIREVDPRVTRVFVEPETAGDEGGLATPL